MNSDSSSKHHRNPVTWVKDKLNLGSSDRLVKSEPIQKQRAQSPPKAKPTIEPTWENLWECAYDKLSGTSSELLKEYGENLRKIQAGDSTDTKDAADNSADKSGSIKTEDKLPTAAEGSLVSFEVVKSTITTLSERRETKQWRLQFSAKLFEVDIGARNQLENLLKLVKWSDDLVKQALSSQPHAALAWTGATMLVSVRITRWCLRASSPLRLRLANLSIHSWSKSLWVNATRCSLASMPSRIPKCTGESVSRHALPMPREVTTKI